MAFSDARTVPDPEFSVSREFDAAPSRVFAAWTEAAMLERWWGPKGMQMKVLELDVRPGGSFRYSMSGPDGTQAFGRFDFKSVEPGSRLVFTNAFTDAAGAVVRHPMVATWPLEVLNILSLTKVGKRTHLTLRGGPVGTDQAEHRTYTEAAEGMQQGFAGTFDQLAAALAATA